MKKTLHLCLLTTLMCGIAGALPGQDLATGKSITLSVSLPETTEPRQGKSLKAALVELEAKFNVSIMADQELIEGKMVTSTRSYKNLEEALKSLLLTTKLKYEKISKNLYVISPITEKEQSFIREIEIKRPGQLEADAVNIPLASLGQSSHLVIASLQKRAIAVSGKVIADTGEGLPGVNVLVKNTAIGTTTDIEGNYSLNVPDGGQTLVFSYIGYTTEEVPIDNRSIINVTLIPDIKALSEVVVVGYGTQKREDLTGSISSVKGSEISKLPVASVTQALQGQVPGVEITTNTGAPGSNMAVRIRGIGTINNTDPLYVVDGLPLFGGLNQINPNDIESIDVLKDASAGAIYGARAANGVVIITTKKGKEGPLQVNFNAYYGTQAPWKKLDLLNADQYRDLMKDVAANAGGDKTPPLSITDPSRQGLDTDWQDLMFRSAPIQSYNLSLSGGSKFATFNISGGYFRQDGILINTRYDRANLQINSQGHKGRFKFGETLMLAGNFNKTEPFYIGGNMFGHMINASPLVNPINATSNGGYGGADDLDGGLQFLNPYGYSNFRDQKSQGLQVLGSVYGQFEIINGLNYRLNLGTDLSAGNSSEFIPTFAMGNISQSRASLANENSNRVSWLVEHTLTYNKSFGLHNVNALLGYSDQNLQNFGFRATAIGFPNNNLRVLEAAESTNKSNEGRISQLHLRSIFARVNYAFANKYLLTATVRRDGSSNFSKNNRCGTFPSLSLGWILSEEAFLKDNPILSLLKLRASYGMLGNQDIGAYNYTPTLNVTSNYPFGIGKDMSVRPGTAPRRLPSDAKWETTKQADIGVELGLFQNSILLVADYFNKQTEGMLVTAPNIPLTAGLPDKPLVNAGGISNKGLELGLNYRKTAGNFNYSVTGNFTTYQNRVTSLGENGQPLYAPGDNGFTKTEVGSSIGRFYGYVVEGIYQTDSEIDKNFALDASAGDIKFKDVNPDGKLDDKDRAYIGSPLPKFTYGLNGNMAYRGFDFSLLFYGVSGNDIVNRNIPGMNSNVNTTALALQRWTPANPNTTVPRAVSGDPNKNYTRFSSRFVEDGSFLRLRNITLGYSLPTLVTEKMHLGSIRVYVSAQNLLTFTKYSGFDPETANGSQSAQNTWFASQNLLRGVDNGTFPLARTILGGIQIGF